jgi:hypothetical protein
MHDTIAFAPAADAFEASPLAIAPAAALPKSPARNKGSGIGRLRSWIQENAIVMAESRAAK